MLSVQRPPITMNDSHCHRHLSRVRQHTYLDEQHLVYYVLSAHAHTACTAAINIGGSLNTDDYWLEIQANREPEYHCYYKIKIV